MMTGLTYYGREILDFILFIVGVGVIAVLTSYWEDK